MPGRVTEMPAVAEAKRRAAAMGWPSASATAKPPLEAFPSSGEVKFRVKDAKTLIAKIAYTYGAQAEDVERLDGHSFDMGAWRFNLRSSNTEPLLRLNVEARADRGGDAGLVALKVAELSGVIGG